MTDLKRLNRALEEISAQHSRTAYNAAIAVAGERFRQPGPEPVPMAYGVLSSISDFQETFVRPRAGGAQ